LNLPMLDETYADARSTVPQIGSLPGGLVR
jgi:hypothetical protein